MGHGSTENGWQRKSWPPSPMTMRFCSLILLRKSARNTSSSHSLLFDQISFTLLIVKFILLPKHLVYTHTHTQTHTHKHTLFSRFRWDRSRWHPCTSLLSSLLSRRRLTKKTGATWMVWILQEGPHPPCLSYQPQNMSSTSIFWPGCSWSSCCILVLVYTLGNSKADSCNLWHNWLGRLWFWNPFPAWLFFN